MTRCGPGPTFISVAPPGSGPRCREDIAPVNPRPCASEGAGLGAGRPLNDATPRKRCRGRGPRHGRREMGRGPERPHVPPGSRRPGARRLLPENREQEAIDVPSASGFACRACAPNLSAVSRACGIGRRVASQLYTPAVEERPRFVLMPMDRPAFRATVAAADRYHGVRHAAGQSFRSRSLRAANCP